MSHLAQAEASYWDFVNQCVTFWLFRPYFIYFLWFIFLRAWVLLTFSISSGCICGVQWDVFLATTWWMNIKFEADIHNINCSSFVESMIRFQFQGFPAKPAKQMGTEQLYIGKVNLLSSILFHLGATQQKLSCCVIGQWKTALEERLSTKLDGTLTVITEGVFLWNSVSHSCAFSQQQFSDMSLTAV